MKMIYGDETHGGQLAKASQLYQIPVSDWLDLSTGINPNPWPVPSLPASVYSRLPEKIEGMDAAVQAYFSASQYLIGAGSQAFIQLLPLLFEQQYQRKARVLVSSLTYCEHRIAWCKHNHDIVMIDFADNPDADTLIAQADVVIVVNPNNPTGQLIGKDRLLQWHRVLAARGAWLIVDEAFIDATPVESLCSDTAKENLFVLRSVGKFFGLAGIRSGFVFAEDKQLQAINKLMGPWAISGPAGWITEHALIDSIWQRKAVDKLGESSARLRKLLLTSFDVEIKYTHLFVSLIFDSADQAKSVFQGLAKQGVLTRIFPTANLIRFGIPENETAWLRLESSLRDLAPGA